MVEAFSHAVHGAKTHWSATNAVTGQRVKADSRRELLQKIREAEATNAKRA